MTTRHDLIELAGGYVDSGDLRAEIEVAISYPTVSGTVTGRIALGAYLEDVVVPSLVGLGCTVNRYDSWGGGENSFVIGTRIEDPDLPTVLCYGHADVVNGFEAQWSENRSPWALDVDGDRWYGRGTADNKGQHLINLAALKLALAHQGSLGFNVKFLFECGEEVASPALAEFVAANAPELAADVFIASDGPRLDAETPTIFLGGRGFVDIELTADLRADSYHSGNWGGLLRNPATTLAAAIGTLVNGHGQIGLPALLPNELPASVRAALEDVVPARGPGDPMPDTGWGEGSLTAAERVYGWNTLEVLAIEAGDINDPVDAIPGAARAVLQLRFVTGTDMSGLQDLIQNHLDTQGFSMVRACIISASPASRTDPDNPWVKWAQQSITETTGTVPAVLPNIGGSLPNHVFEDILGLPTLWIPHSYPGCRQHAPNEHMLESIARQGIQIACGLFYDFGHSQTAASALSAATA